MNSKFLVTWTAHGRIREKVIRGLSELSEFVRNCDAYDRKLIRIENVS